MEEVEFVTAVGIENPAGWFENHDKLKYVKAANVTMYHEAYNDDPTEDENHNPITVIHQATSLENMFAGCTDLEYVTGTGSWNPRSVTNFDGVFDGAMNITTLDLTGWHMAGSGRSAVNTFRDMRKLTHITLENDAVLAGTGLKDIRTRALHAGAWKNAAGTIVPAADGNAAGTGAAFEKLYPTTGSSFGSGTITYNWILEGDFASNPNVWWKFVENDSTTGMGTLYIYGNGSGSNFVVTE
jgi:hypothetical protein